ncbi:MULTISPECIES: FtsQ-type POTRA domain-containing protein [unclassified Leucobacter]|uniref:FtsQ-type POTRA domain-containing protein n=1 Tax=unclassified Leucobacter TaxID=2621730 RepID=UPI000699D241|nr:FtsQ-type POTRA domain-containing protein [Leucobacter sp. Ag1]
MRVKRPSGFDREPEPERDAPVAPETSASDHRGGSDGGWLLRRRGSGRAAETPPSDAEATVAEVIPERAEEAQRDPSDLADVLGDARFGTADAGRAAPPERGAFSAPAGASADELATTDLSDAALDARGADGGLIAKLRARSDREPDPIRAAERDLRTATRLRRRRERREQRRFTVHTRRRRRYWLIAAGAVVALALFVAIGVLSPLMAVRDIRVTGASSVDAAKVKDALGRFDGVPLALVDDGEVHRVLADFPLIQRYAIERIPPGTLVVQVEERIPAITVAKGKKFETYDPAGVLVGTADKRPAGVPLATGAASSPGSPAFAASAKIVRDMPDALRKQLASVTASSGQDVRFTLTNGLEVLWGEATETQKKSAVLQALLTGLKGRSVQKIDVSAPNAPVYN